MKIQLLNADFNKQKDFPAGKIVNISVLERTGNKAVIDINGHKTEAVLEADVPDRFLAFTDVSFDSSGKPVFRLRILSSLKKNAEFQNVSSQNLAENIRLFLMEQNLPLTDNYFRAAQWLYRSGLKMDSETCKLLLMANSKFGNELVDIIILFIKQGLIIDQEFIDLFANLKKIYSHFLKKREINDLLELIHQDPKNDDGNNQLIDSLKAFFQKYFGIDSAYDAKLLEYRNEKLLIQSRVENNPEAKRYYFDITTERLGPVMIIADCYKEYNEIKVFLNSDLYDLYLKSGKNIKSIAEGLNLKNPEKRFYIEAGILDHSYLFWLKDNESNLNREQESPFRLDISV